MACVTLLGLLNTCWNWLMEPWPRLLLLALCAWFLHAVRKWFKEGFPGQIGRLRASRSRLVRLLRYPLGAFRPAVELSYALSFMMIGVTVLEITMPTLLKIAQTYRTQMLDFIMVIVTASSIMLVYTSTSEDALTRRTWSEDEREENQRKLKSARRAKVFGILCVLLCVGAPLVAPFSTGLQFQDFILASGILSFIVEALFAVDMVVI